MFSFILNLVIHEILIQGLPHKRDTRGIMGDNNL